jgi:metacaspase-1
MRFISRRRFIQFTGSTLATVGFSQSNFLQQAESYGKVLAKSTPRKIALLVGINDYKSKPLQGCLSDVQLQRHLLKHRFGFKETDIHTLTDKDATRENILQAFEEYLIKQARPDDVVVFHYSGHGSRIVDPDPIFVSFLDNTGLNGTLVPIDALLPPGYPEQGGQVKDIMGHTLFLLMAAVKS